MASVDPNRALVQALCEFDITQQPALDKLQHLHTYIRACKESASQELASSLQALEKAIDGLYDPSESTNAQGDVLAKRQQELQTRIGFVLDRLLPQCTEKAVAAPTSKIEVIGPPQSSRQERRGAITAVDEADCLSGLNLSLSIGDWEMVNKNDAAIKGFGWVGQALDKIPEEGDGNNAKKDDAPN